MKIIKHKTTRFKYCIICIHNMYGGVTYYISYKIYDYGTPQYSSFRVIL